MRGRGVRFCGVPLGWTELIDFRKELGRNSDDSEDLLIFRVLRGSCNLRPGRECQELQVGEVARKRPEIFKFPKPTNWKKRVSLAILFVLLPLPKFKLLNLQRFHLYTCKTTLCLVFAVFNGLFSLLCVTLDSPLMVFLTFLRMYNFVESHRQLGMRREASVAKVPSNSNLDANCTW